MVNATAVWRQRPCDKTAEVPRCCSDIFHREWLKKSSSLSRTMISRRSLRRVFSFTEDELVSSKIFWKIKGNFSAPHTFCKVIATPLAMELSKASSVLRAAQTLFPSQQSPACCFWKPCLDAGCAVILSDTQIQPWATTRKNSRIGWSLLYQSTRQYVRQGRRRWKRWSSRMKHRGRSQRRSSHVSVAVQHKLNVCLCNGRPVCLHHREMARFSISYTCPTSRWCLVVLKAFWPCASCRIFKLLSLFVLWVFWNELPFADKVLAVVTK